MMNDNTDFLLRLKFVSDKNIYLIDFSSFLYDIELLYDYAIVTNIVDYEEYLYRRSTWTVPIWGRFWIRNGRPIKSEHKLNISSLSIQSPGILATILGAGVAAKALKPFVDLAGEIVDWRHDRNKARYEAERAQYEAERALIERDTASIQQDIALELRDGDSPHLSEGDLEYEKMRAEDRIRKRLQKNPIKLIDMSIGAVSDKKEENHDNE